MQKKLGCIKCGYELYDVHPPDEVYTFAKRFKDKDEKAIKIEVACKNCNHMNSLFWVKKSASNRQGLQKT